MKVILSRKGFDSGNGGRPSPILPDGRMISLPIPEWDEKFCYEDLFLDRSRNYTYYDLMKDIGIKEIRYYGSYNEKLRLELPCHVDPDIYREVMNRPEEWKPLYGQIGAPQTHLENQGVGVGDIFLFFGLFRRYKTNERKKHIIFGYLQIGKIIKTASQGDLVEEWMKYHPHIAHEESFKDEKNTIYVARDKLSFNERLPGAGVFRYSEDLVLTAPGQTASVWKLPDFFSREKIMVSYNPKAYSSDGLFHSAAPDRSS